MNSAVSRDRDPGPQPLLGLAAAGATAAAAIFALMVAAAPHRVAGVDGWVARTAARWDLAAGLDRFDLFGPTPVYLVVIAVIGLATVRCPPVTIVYLGGVGAGLLLDVLLTALVPREPPPDGPLAGAGASFPSGDTIQTVLIIGFVPLALWVLSRRPWFALVVLAWLGLAAAGSAAAAAHAGLHWWSDLAGGALWGAALTLLGLWVVGHRRWHRHCNECPWSSAPSSAGSARPDRAGVGAVRLPGTVETAVRAASRVWVPVMVTGLLALSLTAGLPANPEGDSLLIPVEVIGQLGLLALATAGWLVAWRWEAPGAAVLAVTGSALGILAALAYHPAVSVAVAAVFLAPAVGFWLVWQHRSSVRAIAGLALSTALLLGGTWLGAAALYDHYYGPAHPVSALRAPPVDRVVWSWTGGVTGRAATVVAELTENSRQARLLLTPAGDATASAPTTGSPTGSPTGSTTGSTTGLTAGPVSAGRDHVVRLTVDGLAPGTTYRYQLEVDGAADRSRGAGRFRTMPDGPAPLTIAFGACARTGSSGAVFDAIRELRPDLYVATGDLHYGNPSSADIATFANLYRRTLTAPAQAALYRSVPTAYVWDDHDYGGDDADASSPSRPAARAAYGRYVPHHARPAGENGAIYQAFTAGRARIVLTDTRSERTADSMLGARQLAWLERELVAASRTHAVVVWVNPVPWISPADPDADDWGRYPDERRHLADVLAGADVRNLVMVSGDAHLTAIDDGTNTDFSSTGHPGFPLLQAAALDRPGSLKGGPYSHGAFPGPGQFGTLSIDDGGGPAVTVTLTGRNWRGDTLASYRTTLPARPDRG